MTGASRKQLELRYRIEHCGPAHSNRPDMTSVYELLDAGVNPNFGTSAPQSSPIGYALNLMIHSPGVYAKTLSVALIGQGANPLAFDAPFNHDFIKIRTERAVELVRWVCERERDTGERLRGEDGGNLLHTLALIYPVRAAAWISSPDNTCNWQNESRHDGYTPLLVVARRFRDDWRAKREDMGLDAAPLADILMLARAHCQAGGRLEATDDQGKRAVELIQEALTLGARRNLDDFLVPIWARIRQQDESEQMEARTAPAPRHLPRPSRL